MRVVNVRTGKKLPVQIVPLEPSDYDWIQHTGNYKFDWRQRASRKVYKLVLCTAEEDMAFIHGLVALIDLPNSGRIHIDLIENADINQRKHKKWEGVAGCLLAFAAQQAYEKGYNGFISLVPNTKMIGWYMEMYGFQLIATHPRLILALEEVSSFQLIKRYL